MTTPSTTEDTDPRRKRLKKHATRLWERLDRRRRGLSWAFVALGALGAVVALWPLATTVWDLLEFTTGQAWRLAALGECALLLAVGVGWMNRGRTSPVRLVWLILAAWTVAAGAVAAMTVLAWLVLGTPQWQPPEELTPKNLDAIATRAFAIVAGLGGVALLVIAYRRQRTTEADAVRAERAAEREDTKLFNERFTTAYTELGSESAAVRLGAVQALAHLADDAPSDEEVQMVIDVLCAYLRMPYTPAPAPLPEEPTKEETAEHHDRELDFASFREVRHTIIRIIGNHLRKPTRWRGKNYDFTGVVFDGGDLHGAVLSASQLSFDNARFIGGQMSFDHTTFSGAEVSFSEAVFFDGDVAFDDSVFSGGVVDFTSVLCSGGVVSFAGARFIGGEVSFAGAEFSGSMVSFARTSFSGGRVYFYGAKFSEGVVTFEKADLLDGELAFSGEGALKDAQGNAPAGLPEATKRGKPGMVMLPEHWRPIVDRSSEQEGADTSTDELGR